MIRTRRFLKWFPDGELNICYNAIDRHVKGNRKNKLAYIWEGEMGEVKLTLLSTLP
jgi:acetyl-CoA synthetase